MASVIIVTTFSLIFVIQFVSTPKEAKLETVLPRSAKLVQVHREKVYIWAKRLGLLVIILGIPGLVIPGDARIAALTLSGFTLFVAVILLPIGYVNARRFDVSLTALECDPWIHWKYTPEQWIEWTGVQIQRLEATPPKFIVKRDWRKLGWTLAAIAGATFLFNPGRWLLDSLCVFFGCGLILAVAVWSPHENQHAAERLRATLLKISPEVYFGHDGVFCDGIFTTWLTTNVYLTAASIDERQPRSLLFRFETIAPNPYEGYPVVAICHNVLIPPDSQSDVARLQKELAARCPKAQIALCSS